MESLCYCAVVTYFFLIYDIYVCMYMYYNSNMFTIGTFDFSTAISWIIKCRMHKYMILSHWISAC